MTAASSNAFVLHCRICFYSVEMCLLLVDSRGMSRQLGCAPSKTQLSLLFFKPVPKYLHSCKHWFFFFSLVITWDYFLCQISNFCGQHPTLHDLLSPMAVAKAARGITVMENFLEWLRPQRPLGFNISPTLIPAQIMLLPCYNRSAALRLCTHHTH